MTGTCVGIINVCQPDWQCEQPLNGFESDGCGNRRVNPSCNPPCIPEWVCESGQTGYEIDGCGNRRQNPVCLKTGSLTFASFPSGAMIIIDGEEYEEIKTPATVYDIPVGTHSFVLKLEGFKDYQGTVEVLEDQTVAVPSADLIPNESCIYFASNPPGARIIVDDVDTGQVTPVLICGLSLGSHTYRLELAGYQIASGSVGIGAGQGRVIVAPLVQERKGVAALLGLTLLGFVALGTVMVASK